MFCYWLVRPRAKAFLVIINWFVSVVQCVEATCDGTELVN